MSELTRREVLEAASVLAALPALLAACGRDGGLPIDPPPALLAKGLTSGLVWNRFCATLEDAADALSNDAAPRSASDLAEGYRMITRLLGLALEMVVEGSDADRPAFFELQSPIRKYAGDNPDQRYAAAVIAGDRRYRIQGQRGNAVLVEVSVYAGSFSGGGQRRLVATLTEEALAFAPDGSIEIELAPHPDLSRPNQIQLAPDAINVLVRQYFADPHDKQAAWRIERVPRAEPAPPLAADWLGGRLLGAALFVERNVKTWVEFVAERARGPHNRLAPLADAGDLQTPKGVRYLEGYWKLADGEALVLEFEPAPVPYWGFLVMNFWMESLEWRDRRVSLNSFQAAREADGRTVRMVVAAARSRPPELDRHGRARRGADVAALGARRRHAARGALPRGRARRALEGARLSVTVGARPGVHGIGSRLAADWGLPLRRCLHCDAESPTRARFCMQCGAPLDPVCASCGADLPAGARFCPSCAHPAPTATPRPDEEVRSPRDYTPRHLAEKILRSRSALEGERKLVTVLFADVKDSTALAERLDPEAWHRILDRFFAVLSEGVHRFEGTINQYTGDGIMALFGAPIAHEDHAQRACYAALWLQGELRRFSEELRASHGLEFGARIGIHSGEVVVGKIGDDLRMDYTAQGHTVGLAARMEGLAPAGGVCVSEATARLVEGYVTLRDLGSARVKGASEPVRVFALEGPGEIRTRFEQARARGLTRFVGREDDMAVLEQALAQARAGSGQVVGVVAEAGAGKSRLCFEFVERCRARGIRVDEAHCPAHGKNASYRLFYELLRRMLGVERAGEVETRRQLESELLGLDASFQGSLPLVFDLMGVPDPERPAPQLGPEVRRRQLGDFVRQLVKARSEHAPRVLLVDDAHWIDAASDLLVAEMIGAVPETRTLVVVNFRPEYHADWMKGSSYRQLPLLALGREATEALLADLVGRDASLAGLVERIHEHTRGNPFFIEEVVLALVETGSLEGARGERRLMAPVTKLEIPIGVHAVLAARIDRLPEREKRLLQVASVIGREVPMRVLERTAELPAAELPEALAALLEREFLLQKTFHPRAEYAFRHPLTHEVAYRSQLSERRARTHSATARALEEVESERLEEQAPLLAYHWEAAGEPVPAARWNVRAAAAAVRTDPSGALRGFQKARSLLSEVAEGDERSRLELEACKGILPLSNVMRTGGEEVPAAFARGRALAEAGGDLRSLAHLHIHYGLWSNFNRGDSAGLARHARQAGEFAERAGDAGGAMLAAATLALAGFHEGRVLETIAAGKRALAQAPGDLMLGSEYWIFSPTLWLMGFVPYLEGWAGRSADGLAAFERPLEVAQRQGDFGAEALLHMWATGHAEFLGDAAGALMHGSRALELAQKGGTRSFLGFAYYFLGIAHLLAGDAREAASALERVLEIEGEAGGAEVVNCWSRLAVAYAELGQRERAREAAARGVTLVRKRGLPIFLALALLLQAQVLRRTAGAASRDPIEAALAEARALVERTGIRAWQPVLHVEAGELAGLLGDETLRERELREAHRLYTAMGATGHVDRVGRRLAR